MADHFAVAPLGRRVVGVVVVDKEPLFCPNCDVTMDLHPSDDPSPWACDIAKMKAQLLDGFGVLFRG